VNREGRPTEVTSAGRAFRTRALATEKARRPTVGSLTAETHRSSEVEACLLYSAVAISYSFTYSGGGSHIKSFIATFILRNQKPKPQRKEQCWSFETCFLSRDVSNIYLSCLCLVSVSKDTCLVLTRVSDLYVSSCLCLMTVLVCLSALCTLFMICSVS